MPDFYDGSDDAVELPSYFGQTPEDQAKTMGTGGGVGTVNQMGPDDLPRSRGGGGVIGYGGRGEPTTREEIGLGFGNLDMSVMEARRKLANPYAE